MGIRARNDAKRPVLCAITAVVLAMGLGNGTAQASTITYANLASWQNAVSGVGAPSTFEENALGTFTTYGSVATIDGVMYSVDFGSLYTVDPNYASPYDLIGTGDVLSAQFANVFTATFPATTALAFDWYVQTTHLVLMTLSNGDSVYIDTSLTPLGFLGLTSSTPFTSFTIDVRQRLLNIDNFTLASAGATPNAVPEPASLLLVAGPLALLLRRLTRRRNS